MEVLRRLSELKARALRGGQEEIIEAHNFLSGDLVLSARSFADGRTRAEAMA